MTIGCVIPAAGRGERLGGAVPKALRKLDGRTLLEHAVRAMAASKAITSIVVAAPPDQLSEVEFLIEAIKLDQQTRVVAGGDTRTESVSLAIAALPGDCEIVLIHDAARPLVPVEVVDQVIATCRTGVEAVVPVLEVTDTIKRVDATGRIIDTVDRDQLRAAQTPQGFARAALGEALAQATEATTDEARLMERSGANVITIPGHADSLKITRSFDLLIAEAILKERQSGQIQ